eukprot:TRINITY_DN47112_c0_g1_i1.p1 TRINITY_DN47112_c0_g1~~TRINITY_DN47112_c0_g1_i1.p1  ORF type:complete len:119 (-),score=7.19 TRINITY_DN47112_c0_g1_i1:157-513(-)
MLRVPPLEGDSSLDGAMQTDDPLCRMWRLPRYDQGRYDKDCPVQSTIVGCFREIVPARPVHSTAATAGVGVRRLARLREWREGSGARSRSVPFELKKRSSEDNVASSAGNADVCSRGE